MDDTPRVILVVDDDEASGRLACRIFGFAGYTTAWVDSGAAALKHVAASAPRLIMLDVTMPDMDGLEVLRSLKADPVSAAIPVVMLSALSDPWVADAARALGAHDYAVKCDISMDELVALAERLSGPP